MTERTLHDLVAVVTGGGRGIGRAEACRLAAYGARVVVNDVGVAPDGRPTSETPAEEVAREIVADGGEAVAHASDISSTEGAEDLIRTALQGYGRLDIVVNNAGIGRPRMIFNMSDEEWDDVIRVHLRGTFLVTRAACRWWRGEAKAARPVYGRIVNTSSGLIMLGGAGQSNYVAAKAGVYAFTEAVASEMERYGVTVNAIMPGARTRLANIGWRMDRVEREETKPELHDPVHVAELVCYLASPAAGWLSGQCFQVRGGLIGHVTSLHEELKLERSEAYTAAELEREIPRMFGLGPKAAERPSEEWQEEYRRRRASEGTPP